MLLLKSPTTTGDTAFRMYDRRSFTLTVKVHFPTTKFSLCICDRVAPFRDVNVWGLSWHELGGFAVFSAAGASEWHTLDPYFSDESFMRELRLRFTSGQQPRLTYAVDGGGETDIAESFHAEKVIPPNADMWAFVAVGDEASHGDEIRPISIVEWGA